MKPVPDRNQLAAQINAGDAGKTPETARTESVATRCMVHVQSLWTDRGTWSMKTTSSLSLLGLSTRHLAHQGGPSVVSSSGVAGTRGDPERSSRGKA